MKPLTRQIALIVSIGLGATLVSGCQHTRALIQSSHDIYRTSSSEYLVEVVDLPLKDWPKLQKFTKLSDVSIRGKMTPQVIDECLLALSRQNLPQMRALRLECSATDKGLEALTNLPSIICLDLFGPCVTDNGVKMLCSGMPHLNSISFAECTTLTVTGYLNLTNSPTLREVLMSVENLTQDKVERIMTEVRQVTYWGIDKPTWKLSLGPLKRLKDKRGLTIVIMDNHYGRGIEDAIQSP